MFGDFDINALMAQAQQLQEDLARAQAELAEKTFTASAGGGLVTVAITLLGPTFTLPSWALGISPLFHIPNVTDTAPDWAGLLWLALVIVLLTVVGFVGYRRRSIV